MGRLDKRRLAAFFASLALAACDEPGSGNTGGTLTGQDAVNLDAVGGADGSGGDGVGADTSPVSDVLTPPSDTVNPPSDTASPPPDVVILPDVVDPPAPSGPVDPNCIDGAYSEALPTINANIGGISYDASAEKQYAYAVLDARWPIGRWVLENGVAQGGVNGTAQDCFDFFRASFPGGQSGLMQSLSTLVHECGHGFDSANFGQFGAPSTYELTPDLTLACPSGGGTPPWGDGSTPPRGALQQDQWESLHPSCQSFQQQGCNSYGLVYLGQQGSDQGFNSVLEETLQYINSLGTDYAFVDQAGPFSAGSSRDGILTFLWFVQRYLYLARNEYPNAYNLLTSDCWRDAILTVWGRAWLYIDATTSYPQLGIDDDMLMALVMDDVLLNEIQLLRDAGSCN